MSGQNETARPITAVHLLVALALFIMAQPLIDDLRYRVFVDAVLLTAVLVSALLAVGARGRDLVYSAVLITPAVAGKWAAGIWPDRVPQEIYLIAGMLFIAYVSSHLLRHVLQTKRVTMELLCAAVSNYLLFGVLCSFAYLCIARFKPGAFAFTSGPPGQALDSFSALYFSFTTLSTAAYGDILPVARPARMLAYVESIAGLFYMATLVARLVALYSSGKKS